MVKSKKLIIGIDPDVHKNGVAVYWKEDGKRHLELHSLRFFELFDFLNHLKESIKLVVIEGGWLNYKSNYRITKGNGINARIGAKVGANHETGKKIVEMCVYIGIIYNIVKPLKKSWKGSEGKITHKELEQMTKIDLKRTNQEQRDATLLVWGY